MDKGFVLGKVTEKIKLTSLFDNTKRAEVEAVTDTGATMLTLPQDLVARPSLRKIKDAKAKYANNKVELKEAYGIVTVQLKGRVGIFEVLVETPGFQLLVGQIVLESLDFVVDPKTRTLRPNPTSPEIPTVEIL